MTQSQIAERMGYSQMHISRLLAKALDTLRINPSFRDWRNPVGAAVPSGHFATGVECE